MVVDSSALVAILLNEPERNAFMGAIEGAEGAALLSAVSLLEVSLVLAHRRGAEQLARLDAFLETTGIEVVPFTPDEALVARDAFLRFGKGRHPAGLNFGDCAAYALARSRDLPLLYKGEDFARTDILAASIDR